MCGATSWTNQVGYIIQHGSQGCMVDNHTLALGLCPCAHLVIDHKSWLLCYSYNIHANTSATVTLQ